MKSMTEELMAHNEAMDAIEERINKMLVECESVVLEDSERHQ